MYRGGSAITTERTYVFINISADEALVFFGSLYAYSCKYTDLNFQSDIASHSIAGMLGKEKYASLED